MPTFGNLSLKKYEDWLDTKGEARADAIFICPWAVREAARNTLLGAVNEFNTALMYHRVKINHLQDPSGDLVAELHAEAIPRYKVEQDEVDAPFKFRIEQSSEAVTVAGGYHWADNKKLKDTNLNKILPVKKFTIYKCTLCGCRSVFHLGTYSAYQDKVNSDTFLGAPAETVRFDTLSVSERQDKDGVTVYEVELHLEFKPSGWNKFYREKPVGFEELLEDGTNAKVYSSTAFAGLLT